VKVVFHFEHDFPAITRNLKSIRSGRFTGACNETHPSRHLDIP
jgi:hypothetical protein